MKRCRLRASRSVRRQRQRVKCHLIAIRLMCETRKCVDWRGRRARRRACARASSFVRERFYSCWTSSPLLLPSPFPPLLWTSSVALGLAKVANSIMTPSTTSQQAVVGFSKSSTSHRSTSFIHATHSRARVLVQESDDGLARLVKLWGHDAICHRDLRCERERLG